MKLALSAAATLLLALALAACGDDGGPAAAPTATGSASDATATAAPATPAACIDRSDLPREGAPYEVGEGSLVFRFGLPEEVLQSGEVCPGDLRLVVVRVPPEIAAGEAPRLVVRNTKGDERFEPEADPVMVPGEEHLGAFYNYVVALPDAGTWEFSASVGEASGVYTVPVRAAP